MTKGETDERTDMIINTVNTMRFMSPPARVQRQRGARNWQGMGGEGG